MKNTEYENSSDDEARVDTGVTETEKFADDNSGADENEDNQKR
jgi:hypothetical protein